MMGDEGFRLWILASDPEEP